MSCKLHPGFLNDNNPEECEIHADDTRFKNPCVQETHEKCSHHGVFDTLFEQVCTQELQPAALTYDPHCPVCLGRAERFDGFYAQWGSASTLHARTVQRRILTRVAIDRKRRTAAEGLLYSPIVISEMNAFRHDPDQVYHSTSFLAQVWELNDERIRAALERVARIGARISSGLGQVKLKVQPVPAHDAIHERVTTFQQQFADCWQVFTKLAPQHDPGWSPATWRVFSIGLQSDALLHEQGWQPTAMLSTAQLAEQTGLAATPVYAQTTARVVGGWNVRWNRPKPTQVGAAAGSVFFFRTQASTEAIAAALQILEEQGIGQRRAEGFGVVRGCDTFHGMATGAHQ
jgi:CRISPR-associated protein Csx10